MIVAWELLLLCIAEFEILCTNTRDNWKATQKRLIIVEVVYTIEMNAPN